MWIVLIEDTNVDLCHISKTCFCSTWFGLWLKKEEGKTIQEDALYYDIVN